MKIALRKRTLSPVRLVLEIRLDLIILPKLQRNNRFIRINLYATCCCFFAIREYNLIQYNLN